MADNGEQIELATEVTVAWMSNPHTRADAEDVAAMLAAVTAAMRRLGTATATQTPTGAQPAAAAPEYPPAVTVRRSLASDEHIISMIDGQPYRALKRHLRTNGLTPDQYRERYGLKPDYPMVAPAYSAVRRDVSKRHNFGRPIAAAPTVPNTTERETAAPETTESATKRPRLSISGAKQAAQAHLGTKDGGSEPTES